MAIRNGIECSIGLNVQDILRTVIRAVVEIAVVLNRNTDEEGTASKQP